MNLVSEETFEVSNSYIDIQDSLKDNIKVNVKIDAAHAGVVNNNFLFYTPKALKYGSTSLNKFYKPLQKKHYDKTLGYIYKSDYVETNTQSPHYLKIMNSKTPEELSKAVKAYIKSKDYKNNPKGFGVLIADAVLHDAEKIKSLKSKDTGTVSIAGGSEKAYCSICNGMIAECGHILGSRYGSDTCIAIIADELELDHISFETIPANWETKSLIIADSQLMGKLELTTIEGQTMKLTLVELRDKLATDLESVLEEIGLKGYLEQYQKDASESLKSGFLIAEDSLLPTNTSLTIFVAGKALEALEDGADKEILVSSLGDLYTNLIADKTEDEVKALFAETVSADPVVDPEAVPVVDVTLEPEVPAVAQTPVALEVTDSDKIVLAIADSLSATIDSKFTSLFEQFASLFSKENEAKANKLLTGKIAAYKADLDSAQVFKEHLTDELKESILNQILLLNKVGKDSDYFAKLKTRSIQELKITLEDHLEWSRDNTNPAPAAPVVEPVLLIQDSAQQVDVTSATESMEDKTPLTLEIEDSDKIINAIVDGVSEKVSKNAYVSLYKKTVFEHGSKVAKKLHSALKAQDKI